MAKKSIDFSQVVLAADAKAAETRAAEFPPLEPFQFRAMLTIANLSATLDEVVEAIQDPTARAIVAAKLEYSTSFRRDDPLFETLAPAIGMTSDEIDALWLQAREFT